MILRLPAIALFSFLLINMVVPQTGPGEYVGHWNGIADGQTGFTLDIELEGTDLVASLNVVDQGIVDLPSEWTEFGSDHSLQLSFELPNELMVVLAGVLNDEGKFIGTYEMGEQAGTFTATKTKTDG